MLIYFFDISRDKEKCSGKYFCILLIIIITYSYYLCLWSSVVGKPNIWEARVYRQKFESLMSQQSGTWSWLMQPWSGQFSVPQLARLINDGHVRTELKIPEDINEIKKLKIGKRSCLNIHDNSW